MNKLNKLKTILNKLSRVVIAYSGGLDSTLLLKVALDTLGKDNVLAVTARSETYPESEYKEAKKIAMGLGVQHITIHTDELGIENFKSNPVDRCYYCKKELFGKLEEIRKECGMTCVLDGTNCDDLKDIRHGRKAAEECGVKSPLLDAGMTKEHIRRLSKRMKLPTWDKPPFACLASRIPFKTPIDLNVLSVIERSEEFLRKLGIKQVRVRVHDNIIRLEVFPEDFPIALKHRKAIAKLLNECGYKYVTLDMIGYRTGSMHE